MLRLFKQLVVHHYQIQTLNGTIAVHIVKHEIEAHDHQPKPQITMKQPLAMIVDLDVKLGLLIIHLIV